eukprot:CAMPEP_0194265080 /NCGR_PEP_ID=MMETSP0169-20130528/429_1 /TAXON_ID=218684 /ORGANISM="Corethron pennatum, Strain L29A3" /LENGTH=115 /DNA_ID=CAMNT_0039005473 /DNA_START=289 /DNA_END=636 /DNA_ORIENTATION=-
MSERSSPTFCATTKKTTVATRAMIDSVLGSAGAEIFGSPGNLSLGMAKGSAGASSSSSSYPRKVAVGCAAVRPAEPARRKAITVVAGVKPHVAVHIDERSRIASAFCIMLRMVLL